MNKEEIATATPSAILEEIFAEIYTIRGELQQSRQAMQDLNSDMEVATKNYQQWTQHLEQVFSDGTVMKIIVKELEKLVAVRTELEEITKEIKTNFQLIAKPQKRRWCGR